jgi:hypothetical protein
MVVVYRLSVLAGPLMALVLIPAAAMIGAWHSRPAGRI